MAVVLNLADRRPPVHYTVRLTHHWNGTVETFVEDVADDARSREAVGDALSRAAIQYGAMGAVDAMHRTLLDRIDKLMGAEAGTPEATELDHLAMVVGAYEAIRWPQTGTQS